MKKKILRILFFLVLICITTFYIYGVKYLVDDELFNYGFAKNIIDGLVPYKDFNMIIPPLFAYITAFILKIFGQKLIIYHIFTSIIILGITYFASKKIKNKAFIVYLFLLIYPYTGYNMFSLLLFFILLNLNEDNKYYKYLEPIIITLMIFTKHTLGLLVIPSLYYSKNRLKTFLMYVVSFLLLILYLFINNSIFEFFDYTVFGMFDFTDKNGTSLNFLFVLEIFIIGVLIYNVIKTKKKEYFYLLMYQIVTFPIVNYIHFMISFIPIVYILLVEFKDKPYFSWFFGVMSISFFITFNYFTVIEYKQSNFEYYKEDTFMKGRIVNNITANSIKVTKKYIEEYSEYKPYIFTNMAYLIKLDIDYPINKFDLINNGNMGYNGNKRYIEEIDDYCKDEKCIFFINELEMNDKAGNQTNQNILHHFSDIKVYKKIYTSNIINVYINQY